MSILSEVRTYGSHQRKQTAILSNTMRCEIHRHKISSPAIKKNTLPAKQCHEKSRGHDGRDVRQERKRTRMAHKVINI